MLTDDGKKEEAIQDIIVTEIPLIARFKPSIANGPAPLSVTFDPSDSTGAIVSYFWDFGDGVVNSERKPTHVFSDPGTYTVVLTIKNKDNITDDFTTQINVE